MSTPRVDAGSGALNPPRANQAPRLAPVPPKTPMIVPVGKIKR
jgi:hypothetical protein